MTDFLPTEEQLAIVSAAASRSESLMISALAGCAKTSTVALLAPVLPTRSILALAFNKKIATELEAALPSHVTVKTMNGLGHGAFAQAIGRRLTVDAKKISKLVTALSKASGSGFSDDEWGNIRNLVNRARASGLIPAKYPQARKGLLSDDSWGWGSSADILGIELTENLMLNARKILEQSIDLALSGTIDYDDQIYMSVLFTGLYPRFHTVLVDEAQDLSPLNHLQLKKVVQERLIVVGDPKQAIYAFRGADSSSMEKIRELRPSWLDFPLTLTFRCPRNIVSRQQEHAPGYRAAESAPEGELLNWSMEKQWTLIQNTPYRGTDGALHIEPKWPKDTQWFDIGNNPNLAILCRNNAPLISLAFKLLRKHISINMLGRDFGKSLKSLILKICGDDNELSIEDCIHRITEWREKEIRLARAVDKEEKVDRIHDQAESLIAIIDSGGIDNLGQCKSALAALFDSPSGQIILSSGHKAKGLEWHTVLHLDPWRIPSKWSRRARDDGDEIPWQQEMNLRYVIETRAKHTLILANLENFQ